MAYPKSLGTILVPIVVLLVSMNYMPCKAQLSTTFYDDTCPTALTTIRDSVRSAVSNNPRTAALLIRLHFHDCFVQVAFNNACFHFLYTQLIHPYCLHDYIQENIIKDTCNYFLNG